MSNQNELELQEQYNKKVIEEILESYKKKGAEKVRLLEYYEYKKWGVYLFEHAVKIQERDQFGNAFRELERNFYSAVEVKPNGQRVDYESKKDSRRTAEDNYSNIIRMIKNFKSKGRL